MSFYTFITLKYPPLQTNIGTINFALGILGLFFMMAILLITFIIARLAFNH